MCGFGTGIQKSSRWRKQQCATLMICLQPCAKPVPQPFSARGEGKGLPGGKDHCRRPGTREAIRRRTVGGCPAEERWPADADARASHLRRPARYGDLLPRVPRQVAPHSAGQPPGTGTDRLHHHRAYAVADKITRPLEASYGHYQHRPSPRLHDQRRLGDSVNCWPTGTLAFATSPWPKPGFRSAKPPRPTITPGRKRSTMSWRVRDGYGSADETRPVGPGDAIAIPPGSLHQIRNTGTFVLKFLAGLRPSL